jgi:hypothetical protein
LDILMCLILLFYQFLDLTWTQESLLPSYSFQILKVDLLWRKICLLEP